MDKEIRKSKYAGFVTTAVLVSLFTLAVTSAFFSRADYYFLESKFFSSYNIVENHRMVEKEIIHLFEIFCGRLPKRAFIALLFSAATSVTMLLSVLNIKNKTFLHELLKLATVLSVGALICIAMTRIYSELYYISFDTETFAAVPDDNYLFTMFDLCFICCAINALVIAGTLSSFRKGIESAWFDDDKSQKISGKPFFLTTVFAALSFVFTFCFAANPDYYFLDSKCGAAFSTYYELYKGAERHTQIEIIRTHYFGDMELGMIRRSYIVAVLAAVAFILFVLALKNVMLKMDKRAHNLAVAATLFNLFALIAFFAMRGYAENHFNDLYNLYGYDFQKCHTFGLYDFSFLAVFANFILDIYFVARVFLKKKETTYKMLPVGFGVLFVVCVISWSLLMGQNAVKKHTVQGIAINYGYNMKRVMGAAHINADYDRPSEADISFALSDDACIRLVNDFNDKEKRRAELYAAGGFLSNPYEKILNGGGMYVSSKVYYRYYYDGKCFLKPQLFVFDKDMKYAGRLALCKSDTGYVCESFLPRSHNDPCIKITSENPDVRFVTLSTFQDYFVDDDNNLYDSRGGITFGIPDVIWGDVYGRLKDFSFSYNEITSTDNLIWIDFSKIN